METHEQQSAKQSAGDGDSVLRPLEIGSVCLRNNLAMAPLAGTTSAPFRSLCHRFGAGLTVSELVSARGILHDEDYAKNARYLARGDDERPAAVQLFGFEPDDFAGAVRRLAEHDEYAAYDLIDINMGCPVKKVMKTGAGAALMADPGRAARIVDAAVRAAGGKPVTVKFRSGLDDGRINAVSFAAQMERAGAAALTLHARTAAQMYAGRADWNVIGAVREAVSIPLFGNGDLTCRDDLSALRATAAVDGFAIGRAAVGRPWLFAELAGRTVTAADRKAAVFFLLEALARLLGERTAVREIRPQLAGMVRGVPDASRWRSAFFAAETAGQVQALVESFFDRAPDADADNRPAAGTSPGLTPAE